MPLEISEIEVRMSIRDGASERHPSCEASPPPDAAATSLTPEQMDEIVARCVRGVLQSLRAQEQR